LCPQACSSLILGAQVPAVVQRVTGGVPSGGRRAGAASGRRRWWRRRGRGGPRDPVHEVGARAQLHGQDREA
jgi:hypothetical protein